MDEEVPIGPYEGDRRKADLEQAQIMARRLKRSSISDAPVDNVHSGLVGLDEADKLQQQGLLAESLKLYETSIELLLKCLRLSSLNVDKDMLLREIRFTAKRLEKNVSDLLLASLMFEPGIVMIQAIYKEQEKLGMTMHHLSLAFLRYHFLTKLEVNES